MHFAPSSLRLGTPKVKILYRDETLVNTGCAAPAIAGSRIYFFYIKVRVALLKKTSHLKIENYKYSFYKKSYSIALGRIH